MRNQLELQLPTIKHRTEADNYKNEFFEAQEKVIPGSALLDQMDYEPWLIHNANNRQEKTVSNSWVVSTTFFAVRKHDGKIVGMLDIRHNLNNEFLSEYGGHIGYSVRPSERKKGYGTEMLKAGLKYAESLKIKKVMIGCFSDNIPSLKTIEKCNGRLSETKAYAGEISLSNTGGKFVNIYWIDLNEVAK